MYGWANSNICREALAWQRLNGQKVNNEFYVAPSYHYLIENGLEISTHSVGLHGVGVHGLGTPTDLEHFLSLDKAKKEHKQRLDCLGL